MLFQPVCYTCGKFIGHLKKDYDKLIEKENIILDNNPVLNTKLTDQTKIFKKLGIKRYCCKKVFFTNVSIYDFIKKY